MLAPKDIDDWMLPDPEIGPESLDDDGGRPMRIPGGASGADPANPEDAL